MKLALAFFALLAVPEVAWAAGVVKVVALTPKVPDHAAASVGQGLAGLIVDALAQHPGVHPLGPDDVTPFLDEAGVAQLGVCDETPACLSELGAAIGADYVLSPTVATIGETWVFSLRFLRPANGAVAGRSTATLPKDEAALVETLCPLVQAGLDDLRKQDSRLKGGQLSCTSTISASSGFDTLPPPPPPPDAPSAERDFRVGARAGLGGQSGILGIGVEGRFRRFALHLGTGTYTLTAATSATFATFALGPVDMSPYAALHVAWTRKRGPFGIEQRPGTSFGATAGLEVMPLRWLSLRGGLGFAYNPQTWGERGYAPLAWDATAGFLF